MSSTDNNDEGQHSCSDPRPIPREPSLKLNNTAQCASFVSQRSSSIDTFGSISPTDNPGETFPDSAGQDGEEFASTPPPNRTLGKKSPAVGEEGGTVGGEGDASTSDRWLCNNEAMPVSMLHPSHRSTPMKDSREYLSAAREGEEVSAARVEGEGDGASDDEEGRPSREIFFPGDLQTPITGYETMEARSKFTVYKIHVQKAGSESEPEGWFIFRRYSDFLHLNERLKHLFPGFRLSLPPKRWFRDNFDMNFLEDRMLGLQAFLDNIIGHKEICNSEPVRAFFCTDEPPGPHDSLEESRALCDTLEESIYGLRQELTDKDAELALLKEEVALYKSQVEILSEQLKKVTGIAPSIAAGKGGSLTPTSPASVSSSSNRSSLADCDNLGVATPVSEAKSETQGAEHLH